MDPLGAVFAVNVKMRCCDESVVPADCGGVKESADVNVHAGASPLP